MKRVRLKKDVREELQRSNNKDLTKKEQDVLKTIEKSNKIARTFYAHLRLGLLAENGFLFDETQENPQARLLRDLFNLGLLEEVSAEKKQESRDLVGNAASLEALERLKQRLCLNLKVYKKAAFGKIPEVNISGITARFTEKFKELTKNENDCLAHDIPEARLSLVLGILKGLSKDIGATRAAIIRVDDKEKRCRMVRLLAGDAEDAPEPIEARIIIAQAYAFYKGVREMNKDTDRLPEKVPVKESIMLNRLEEKRITFMWRDGRPYVLMLETQNALEGMIFHEMEKTMEKALGIL